MVGTKAVRTDAGFAPRAMRGGGLFDRMASLLAERADRSAAEELGRLTWLGDAPRGESTMTSRPEELDLPGHWSRLV